MQMGENAKVAIGLLINLIVMGLLTFAQAAGMLFDASNVFDRAPNPITWFVVASGWIAFFIMLWVFLTRNLNQHNHKKDRPQ
ncbi:hypothetical protein DC852_06250 [Vibrio parahaemolyticus]|nr:MULTISPECIES: hypothetical protein [Vibrio]ARR10340.1 hypothetical protein Vc3S01_p20225 [Vibrio campbellii]EGR3502840.1 hypothetical protein [Vibrio parahaemolyticus]KPM92226.1 hypothetical protein AOR10_13590 [Vibrio alginolyticus]OOH98719.1 hypothetical protein BIW16_18625 [Vibrio sp. OULL4]